DARPIDDAGAGPPPGPPLDPLLAARPGYTLLNLRTAFAKLQSTPAPPQGLIFAPDRPIAFVLLSDPAARVAEVQRIDLAGFAVRTFELGTPPEADGLLPAVERAFVTQTHPEGRISFIPLDEADGRVETVSGFALNGRIE
ncbi:MAG: hypothetical protein KC620_07555, partial [Myxococcales bacterium]|nr:hypothetical protein [Myxococcales bacterium]